MVFTRPLAFVTTFVDSVDSCLRERNAVDGLSHIQKAWLVTCVMGVYLTNTISWASFSRTCLGTYAPGALSWVFVHSKIGWSNLLRASIETVLREHGIAEGTLVIDDTDKRRSKVTTRIWGVSKLLDKASGGFMQGQSIVFLLLVTPSVTVPVGFEFYRPNPARSPWKKQDALLKKQGIVAKDRPRPPAPDPAYPSKLQLALQLIAQFRDQHSCICVKAILADAAYCSSAFMNEASAIYQGVQVVSELRGNQLVRHRERNIPVRDYFRRTGVPTNLPIRGAQPQIAVMDSARIHVHSHGTKRFVIALKYEGEESYRYLVATHLSWRALDIVRTWTLRWLVEVFFEDWKAHEGWGALTKQRGEDGSRRGLILSLLADHCILLHPDQLAQIKRKLPAFTVGSLMNRIKVDALLTAFNDVALASEPTAVLDRLSGVLREQFTLRPSGKHMNGRELGRQEPTPSLRYKSIQPPAMAA